MGCATGAGVTAMIQSSSATTVMLMGFVGAGIMSLEQAVGVVIGANVGTTITGQMIAFKLTNAALPAIAIGVVLKYFSKKRRYRHIGEIILGFGLLFYGLMVMKNGLAPIKNEPEFIMFFTRFSTNTFGGILLCVAMGAGLTVVLQSSSATVGLTMTLATSGLLPLSSALALVLGENIGTTITAQLATIGSRNDAVHRTANAHTIFNVIGVIIILLIFPWFIRLVEWSTLAMGIGEVNVVENHEYVNMARYIANGHTLFNVVNAMVFLVFMPQLIRLVILLSPSQAARRERYPLPHFDDRFMDSPIGALIKVKGEIVKLAEFTRKNLKKTSTCLRVRDDDILGEREAVEDHIDTCQKIIIKYLTTIYQGDVNEGEAREISEMMRITNNIERIGDSMENVSKMLENIYDHNIHFSEEAVHNLSSIAIEVDRFFELVIDALTDKPDDFFQIAAAQEDLIDQMREDMRYMHIRRLREDSCSVDAGVFFITLLSNYEKMGDYCFNIAVGVSRI
jgi:phosphate:Na+ symporter